MPTYCYKCPDCGRTEQRTVPVSERNTEVRCNDCDISMIRDLHAEHGEFIPIREGAWPIFSDAMGVHPSQISEATAANRRFGDNVTYTPDGRAVFESRAQRKAHCERQGFFDRSGGYGDPQRK